MVHTLQFMLFAAAAAMSVHSFRYSPSSSDINTRTDTPRAEPRVWPESAKPNRVKNRKMTNAGRIARGLPVLPPAKLYNPTRVHAAPIARLSQNPPPQYESHDSYYYLACYADAPGTPLSNNLQASTEQDALDACAALAAQQDIQPYYISLRSLSPGTYYCGANPDVSGDSEDCTVGNYAVYDGGA